MNPQTNFIYFASFSSSNTSVSVIDGADNKIVKNLPLTNGFYATALAVNTTTNKIYVALDFSPQQLVKIDGNTNAVQMFTIAGLCNLTDIAVDSSLNRIYAPDDECGGLYIISGRNNKLVEKVLPADGGPVAVSPANHQIADISLNMITFLSGQNDTVIGGDVALPASLQVMSITANAKNR